jgi:MoxR-like ATPases
MENKDRDLELLESFATAIKKIQDEVAKVIVGQKEIINQLLIALFSRGNCLLIGVPGLAKTLMIRTLASALDLKFSRIQFTPDLMPSDITGGIL